MKKTKIVLFFILLGTRLLSAQEADAVKNFRFGLKITPCFTWIKPEDRKNLLKDGVSLKLAYGLNVEYNLNKVASFTTGIEFNNNGGKVAIATPADSNYYDPAQFIYTENGRYYRFFINSRKAKINYLDIPLVLKLRTPEVGEFTYFGMFGFNLGFRMKSKATDNGNMATYLINNTTVDSLVKWEPEIEIPDVNITDELNPIRLGLNAGVGAEYNIAGSTSVVVSFNFHNSFTNVFKKDSGTIRSYSKNNAPFNQDARLNYFQLNLGILF